MVVGKMVATFGHPGPVYADKPLLSFFEYHRGFTFINHHFRMVI
jgi:hypothetical protein